ncbi:hypothetical protein BJ508DRAFT_49625 [Ascobolus immersus RN42]|uniref:Uncharacterized protein n=1 Tax=Ascobolus immersus RN42 TaxID=1160509 RepID=A0A3N4HHM6_ASCIM|nr:hypothetical protein BJ508DRAFT_49625 [Ascobolus immersus RN42]
MIQGHSTCSNSKDAQVRSNQHSAPRRTKAYIYDANSPCYPEPGPTSTNTSVLSFPRDGHENISDFPPGNEDLPGTTLGIPAGLWEPYGSLITSFDVDWSTPLESFSFDFLRHPDFNQTQYTTLHARVVIVDSFDAAVAAFGRATLCKDLKYRKSKGLYSTMNMDFYGTNYSASFNALFFDLQQLYSGERAFDNSSILRYRDSIGGSEGDDAFQYENSLTVPSRVSLFLPGSHPSGVLGVRAQSRTPLAMFRDSTDWQNDLDLWLISQTTPRRRRRGPRTLLALFRLDYLPDYRYSRYLSEWRVISSFRTPDIELRQTIRNREEGWRSNAPCNRNPRCPRCPRCPRLTTSTVRTVRELFLTQRKPFLLCPSSGNFLCVQDSTNGSCVADTDRVLLDGINVQNPTCITPTNATRESKRHFGVSPGSSSNTGTLPFRSSASQLHFDTSVHSSNSLHLFPKTRKTVLTQKGIPPYAYNIQFGFTPNGLGYNRSTRHEHYLMPSLLSVNSMTAVSAY